MKSKILLVVLLGIFMIANVLAVDSLGTFKQNECVEIKQTCSSCSYVNISISYPNSTRAFTNQEMASEGGGVWTYDYCNTSQIGRYEVIGEGDIDGSAESFATYFKISPAGQEELSSGGGLSLLGSLTVMILVAAFFFILSMRLNSTVGKISFIVISSIILLMSVFFSMVVVQQNLGGFESIVSGYSTFFMVLGVLGGIAFTAFMIFALLVAIRFYKFKRGFID